MKRRTALMASLMAVALMPVLFMKPTASATPPTKGAFGGGTVYLKNGADIAEFSPLISNYAQYGDQTPAITNTNYFAPRSVVVMVGYAPIAQASGPSRVWTGVGRLQKYFQGPGGLTYVPLDEQELTFNSEGVAYVELTHGLPAGNAAGNYLVSLHNITFTEGGETKEIVYGNTYLYFQVVQSP